MNLPDEVTRFELYSGGSCIDCDSGSEMAAWDTGEWVKFTDHQARVEAAYRKGREDALEEARAEIEKHLEMEEDIVADYASPEYGRGVATGYRSALASLAGEKEKGCPDTVTAGALTADARDALAGLVRSGDFDEMKLRGVLALLDLAVDGPLSGTGKERG